MKVLNAVAGVILAAASTALAHGGMEHPAGSGLFGLPPEYVHVLINPIPVYGMAMGILALGAALLARNKTAQTIGLGLIILAAASAWPVAHFGQNAYKQVRGQADDAGADALDEHMGRAEKVIYVFYGTAFLGLAALVTRKKFPKAATPLAVATLVMGGASLGAGGWISKAGGQIRHPEFRVMSGTSTNAESHEHGASGHSHETMPPAETGHTHETTTSDHRPSTNAPTHQHDASQPAHEKMPPADTSGHHHEMPASDQNSLPHTVEGVWKEIHEHHGELAASVNARQFKQVQLHAAMIRDLAKRLAELTPGVKSEISKITHALDELNSSAETGSDTVMKIRFKEFEAAMTNSNHQ